MTNTDRPTFKQSAETISVLALLRAAKAGETVTYEAMRASIRTPITTERLRSAIGSARRILLRDAQMVFCSIPMVGYQLLRAEDVVDASDQDVRSIRRKAHMASAKLQTAKTEDLSPDKQGKRDSRMAVFAVASGVFEFAKQKRLPNNGATPSNIRHGMREILDAMENK